MTGPIAIAPRLDSLTYKRDLMRARRVEITADMVAAGAATLASYDTRIEGPEDLVQRIYLEMILAKPVRRRGVSA